MLTARQIEAFRAIMIAGNMTRAADVMCVTQPAVSRLIKDLEQDLGLTLFKRRKGGLYPSEEAMALYTEVERSYVGLEKIARAARQIRTKRAGQLRIAGMPAMALGFLPGVIRDFTRERPDLAITLHAHNSPELVDMVRTRHYDVGFGMTPIDIVGIDMGPVRRAPCVCILPPGHRLASRDAITVEDLADEPFISLSEGTLTRYKIDSAFEAASVPRRLEIEALWSAAICSFVARGMGVSIIEPFTAQEFAAAGGVVVRPFTPVIDFSFAMVRPAGTEMSPLLAEFVEVLEDALAPHLLPANPIPSHG